MDRIYLAQDRDSLVGGGGGEVLVNVVMSL